MIILFSLIQVKLFSASYRLVLCMPEHQIADVEFLSQTGGIHNRTVVLLIGLEAVAFTVKAEGLVKQPVASLDIGGADRIVGLIPRSVFFRFSEWW